MSRLLRPVVAVAALKGCSFFGAVSLLSGCVSSSPPAEPEGSSVDQSRWANAKPVEASSSQASEELPVELEIFPDRIVAGEEVIPYVHEAKYRKWEEIPKGLRGALGLPPSETPVFGRSPREVMAPFTVRIHPQARGAEVMSSFLSAAFRGLGAVQFVPSSILAYARVPTPPGVQPAYLRDMSWPQRPLQVAITGEGVTLWRATDWSAEERPKNLGQAPSGAIEDQLDALLDQVCSRETPCFPFVLNIQNSSWGKDLNSALEVLISRDEARSQSKKPLALIIPGFPNRDPLAVAGSIGPNTELGTSKKIRLGDQQVKGRLPPDVIRKVVRASFGRFRECYERGLARDEKLEGRVTVRFVIDRDGKVSHVINGGVDIPDPRVSECVFKRFYELEFPEPEGGTVTVTYPIQFSPG